MKNLDPSLSKTAVYAIDILRLHDVDATAHAPLLVIRSELQSVLLEVVGRDIMNERLWMPTHRGKGISYITLATRVIMWSHGELNLDVMPNELTRPAKQPVTEVE